MGSVVAALVGRLCAKATSCAPKQPQGGALDDTDYTYTFCYENDKRANTFFMRTTAVPLSTCEKSHECRHVPIPRKKRDGDR